MLTTITQQKNSKYLINLKQKNASITKFEIKTVTTDRKSFIY